MNRHAVCLISLCLVMCLTSCTQQTSHPIEIEVRDEEVVVQGKWFWTGEPFEFKTTLSDRNFTREQNKLILLLQPDLSLHSEWGTMGRESIDEKFLMQKYHDVVPMIVRDKDDHLNFRVLMKQDHFYSRPLRSMSNSGSVSSYFGWIDVSKPDSTLRIGYWMEEKTGFDAWKLQTTTETILPKNSTDTVVIFEIDKLEHTATVYHLPLAANLDLFDYEPCSHERLGHLTPIVALKMQPATAYPPATLAKLLEVKVVDLR